jgi:hypothetical protein
MVQDEGAAAGARPTLNFIGAGVVAVDNPGADRVDVTVSGAGGGGAVASVSSLATTTITTTADALVNSMSIVAPSSGNYLLFFDTSINPNNDYIFRYSFYVNGVQIANSERQHKKLEDISPIGVHAYVTGVVAGQVIEVRGRNSVLAASTVIFERTLSIMKAA